MSFVGANINKLNGGLNRGAANEDRVIVLIVGMTPPSGMSLNEPKVLYEITDAEDLGITASSDDTNNELTHYHLSEAFRLCPGFKYWLIPIDKTSTITTLVANSELKESIRSIKDINVLLISGILTPITDSLTDAVKLQTLVNEFATEHLLIDGVFVEGQGSAVALSPSEYPDLRTITAPNVTYVISQDPSIAELKSAYQYHASIGTVAGSIAVRKVHEDLGSVDIEEKPRHRKGEENYSLSDEATGRWLSSALSDGTAFRSLSVIQQKLLTSKGYMYVGSFADYGGLYLNGCPTSVSKSSDYAYFNLNCIWNKAARIIRKTLIPKIRSKIPTDPTTGYLKSTWVSACEGSVKSRLGTMETAGNIDGYDVYISPEQNPTEDVPLAVKGQLVVGKIVHEFDVDLGLTDKIS